jgi:hypothetical protein
VKQRPDPQRRIVSGCDQRGAIGGERNAVDPLSVTFKHARMASPRKRPKPHRVVPRCGGEARAIGRDAECGHGSRMTGEHDGRLTLPPVPDRDTGIFPARDNATIVEEADRIHGAFVETQHLLRGVFA